ncbi:hypothetical protein [Anatilimnocola floriformis]|uniref:hypothetical protein n=1 Tax=Anatilimnocola floriformis TaxID=2948575 RepID=UPI0020C1BC5C|nr:hypothetical protein [Anatilimnocola floriformis]
MRAAMLLLIVLGFATGCGSSFATVDGMVTFDGQPVEQGAIVFEPADRQGAVAGATIQNGKYRIGPESKMAPGNMTVRITAMRTTGKKIKAGPPAPEGTLVDEVLPYPSSNNEKTAQVQAGNGIHNFELQSPK